MDLIFGPTTDWRLFSHRIAGCACLEACLDKCACIQCSPAYHQGCLTSQYLSSVLSSVPLPPIFECNTECCCQPELCENRVVQRHLENPDWLSVREVDNVRHRGVFTTRVIDPGECVCVYIGEVIGCEEAARREKEQLDNLGHTYILTIKECRLHEKRTPKWQTNRADSYKDCSEKQTLCKDDHLTSVGHASREDTEDQTTHVNSDGHASREDAEDQTTHVNSDGHASREDTEGQTTHVNTDGHASREVAECQTTYVDGFTESEDEEQAVASFINHSCSPNCLLLPVRVDHMIPYCALFASRKINIDEEITIDYGRHCELSDRPCLCKAVDCRGFLPRSATAYDRE